MTTSGVSGTTGAYALLQSLLQGVSTDLSNGNNLQSSPSSSVENAAPPPPPPAPVSDSSASSQFSGETLSSLVSTQDTSATAEAYQIVDDFDTNGEGSLSLSDIENALSGASGASGASTSSSAATASSTTSSLSLSTSSLSSSSVQAAFNAIDTNGDGELSTSEIAAALENLDAGPSVQGPPMGPPPSPPAGSDASSASSSANASSSIASSDASSASASSTTTSTPSSTALSESQIANLLQSLVAQLASLQYDAASGLQNAAAAGTIATTTA